MIGSALKFIVLVVGLLALLLSWGTPRSSLRPADFWSVLYGSKERTGLSQMLQQAEYESGVSADLLRAIIFAESGFNPLATSSKGAQGLMQVMPATARSMGFVPSYDSQRNLQAGVHYFASLLRRFNGEIPLALAAYNAGPAAVEKYRGIPPYRETRLYVAKVLSLYKFFRGDARS